MVTFLIVEPSTARRDLDAAIANSVRQGQPITLLTYGAGSIFQAVTALGFPKLRWSVMGWTFTS